MPEFFCGMQSRDKPDPNTTNKQSLFSRRCRSRPLDSPELVALQKPQRPPTANPRPSMTTSVRSPRFVPGKRVVQVSSLRPRHPVLLSCSRVQPAFFSWTVWTAVPFDRPIETGTVFGSGPWVRPGSGGVSTLYGHAPPAPPSLLGLINPKRGSANHIRTGFGLATSIVRQIFDHACFDPRLLGPSGPLHMHVEGGDGRGTVRPARIRDVQPKQAHLEGLRSSGRESQGAHQDDLSIRRIWRWTGGVRRREQ